MKLLATFRRGRIRT